MGEAVRWGILGAARFAREHMAPAIHGARGAELVAVASRDPARVAPFAELVPGLTAHGSYEALLDDDGVDAVYIPLPNHLHVPWAEKALRAGKHVLCEKPVSMSVAELDQLIAVRDGAGRLAAEAYMIVHHPQWLKTRALLAEGAIGRLLHVDAIFTNNNADEPENIRNQRGMGGGGLRDLGVYTFGSVRFATGTEPEELGARLVMEQDFDVVARMTGAFPGFGYHALVSTRMAKRQSVVFHGSEGVLRVKTPFNPNAHDQAELHLERRENEVTVLRYPGVNQYVLQVEAFCAAVRDGTTFPWPLEQSRGTQAMIDTALKGEMRVD